MNKLNERLATLAKVLPSTTAGIEAMDLISNALANVTNEQFKQRVIVHIEKRFAEYIKTPGHWVAK